MNFIVVNFEQLLNILFILVVKLKSKFDKSNVCKLLQLLNISSIEFWFKGLFIFDKSIDFKLHISLNIESKFVIVDASKFFKFKYSTVIHKIPNIYEALEIALKSKFGKFIVFKLRKLKL